MHTNDSYRKQVLNEYLARINRVVDYIESNLSENLTLDGLAMVAGFSKYHFNRIFFSFCGETLFKFITRLRLEKSANLLLGDPDKLITEIAYECGFENPSSFSRSFKKHFSESATAWRRKGKLIPNSNPGKVQSNIGQYNSNHGNESRLSSVYIEYANKSQLWRVTMNNKTQTVEVKELPEMTVAYVRYVGPYKGDAKLFESLYGKLFKWAGPRGLINFPETKSIIIYHDDPEITEENKLRISVCVTVPADTVVDGVIGKMVIPGGKYALARFELTAADFQEAWDWVCGSWLPESGYLPDDRPCFELYHNDHKDSQNEKVIVDICVPVKPL